MPGKKFFTWGNGGDGRAWDNLLTDTDGAYLELMVGGYSDNQPDYSWIQPLRGQNGEGVLVSLPRYGGREECEPGCGGKPRGQRCESTGRSEHYLCLPGRARAPDRGGEDDLGPHHSDIAVAAILHRSRHSLRSRSNGTSRQRLGRREGTRILPARCKNRDANARQCHASRPSRQDRHRRRASVSRAAPGTVLQSGASTRRLLRGGAQARSLGLPRQYRPRAPVLPPGALRTGRTAIQGGSRSGDKELYASSRWRSAVSTLASLSALKETSRPLRTRYTAPPGVTPWHTASYYALAELQTEVGRTRRLWSLSMLPSARAIGTPRL